MASSPTTPNLLAVKAQDGEALKLFQGRNVHLQDFRFIASCQPHFPNGWQLLGFSSVRRRSVPWAAALLCCPPGAVMTAHPRAERAHARQRAQERSSQEGGRKRRSWAAGGPGSQDSPPPGPRRLEGPASLQTVQPTRKIPLP